MSFLQELRLDYYKIIARVIPYTENSWERDVVYTKDVHWEYIAQKSKSQNVYKWCIKTASNCSMKMYQLGLDGKIVTYSMIKSSKYLRSFMPSQFWINTSVHFLKKWLGVLEFLSMPFICAIKFWLKYANLSLSDVLKFTLRKRCLQELKEREFKMAVTKNFPLPSFLPQMRCFMISGCFWTANYITFPCTYFSRCRKMPVWHNP